jgi:tetratricopeptide (TPR) repeat protein
MELHFTSQDFRELAGGELPKDKARALVAHLLRGCHACQAESAALWRAPKAVPEDAYDAVFDRVLAACRGAAAAPAAVAERAARPSPLQELAGVSAEVEGPDLVAALLQRAWNLRHENLADMRRTARIAVLAADGLSFEVYGMPQVSDVQCRALAAYGNACRIAGDFGEAQHALDRAAELLPLGSGDALTRAQLYEFQASLESARGNYDLALTALDAACAIHLERGDRHLAGRALIAKGLHISYAGRPREARRLTQQGLEMVDETRDPGLVLSALHNELWFLLESGRAREARSLLGAYRDRLATGESQRLDLLWLEGRIKAGLRDEKGALLDLEAAERGFAATGRRSRAANVKLDQAAVHLLLGNSAQALALVRAAEQVLATTETSKSVLMALAFLRRTLADRQVSAQFVLRLANIVRRNQREF